MPADSLLAQTLKDLEIILVDDGSPDCCGEMADKYAAKDNRVVVVHRGNGGLGPARNSGIDVAKGAYIGFVDSDDWVEPGMYERLFLEAKKSQADIVVSGHCDVTNGTKTYIKRHPLSGQVLNAPQIADVRLNLYGHGMSDSVIEAFPMSVCMSIYKRSMIELHQLKFRKILSEDIFFNLSAYAAAERIAFVEITDYCYRKDDQASITRTFDESKLGQFQGFIGNLMDCARLESETIRHECMMRVQRTAIDYARLYMGLIVQDDSRFRDKLLCCKRFYDSGFLDYCGTYPLDILPVQQRLFQKLLIDKHFASALFVCQLRLALKRKK